jgi:hypothetical protein
LGVQADDGITEASGKERFRIGIALRFAAIRARYRVIYAGVAQRCEVIEEDGFNFGF